MNAQGIVKGDIHDIVNIDVHVMFMVIYFSRLTRPPGEIFNPRSSICLYFSSGCVSIKIQSSSAVSQCRSTGSFIGRLMESI